MTTTHASRPSHGGSDVSAPARNWGPRLVAGMIGRPRLFAALDRGAAGPVTLVSAPAGSGKSMLVSSWLRTSPPSGAIAWVSVDRDETDVTHFWNSVMDALRSSGAIAPDDALATLAPAPLAGPAEFLGHLTDGLARLTQPVHLVLDDLHHLRSPDGPATVEELIRRAPAQLHLVIISRHDPKIGLHRLRLSGELTEIRATDLNFTDEEAAELLGAAGVTVAGDDVARLCARTEGWAAGLRLAAMSLTGHREPAAFVAEFSGSERTVAEYLLGEVLANLPDEVRNLLLCTCVLERVNGPLADLLTGRRDGTDLLHQLEEANAFVVAVDAARTWFRYHHLLADLLRLELRREQPDRIAHLHRLAADWFAENGATVDAIRHSQLGEDWNRATELLGQQWVHLVLDGEEATLASLLGGFPAGLVESDSELATIVAAGRLSQSRWHEADQLLRAAKLMISDVPPARRQRADIALATVELLRARRVGDLESVTDRLEAILDADAHVDVELRALALMNLGIVENWTLRLAAGEQHLEHGLMLSRRTGRAYLEIGCLSGLGVGAAMTERLQRAEDLLREAAGIADRLGWTSQPVVAACYVSLAAVLVERGMLSEGEQWLARATPTLVSGPEPAAAVGMHHVAGMLAFVRGQAAAALAAFTAGEEVGEQLSVPHFLNVVEQQWQWRARLLLGETEAVRTALDRAGTAVRTDALWANLAARLHLAVDEGQAALAAVSPVLAGQATGFHANAVLEALFLDALTRHRMGDAAGAEHSVEAALELGEPQGRVWIALTIPGLRDVLAAQPTHRTAHGSYLRTLIDHVSGIEPSPTVSRQFTETLSERELAVLRLLPTNLSAGEMGRELLLSVHTVKTHMRKLYAKLDAHTRAEAVQRGRALGLLGPNRVR